MKRNKGIFSIILLIMAFYLTAAATARANESDFSRAFMKAYNTNIGMKQIIEKNRDIIPTQIETLLEQSHDINITPEQRERKQYMAETMARAYKKVTGDISYLIYVKKTIFNSRLHAPVNRTDTKEIHIVDIPLATEGEKNVLEPDNIVIHAGETIRWVNNASIAQRLTSMPLIGRQVMFTPNIEPDETWAHSFNEPGEYYYFGYSHRSMMGKITVLPAAEKALWEGRASEVTEQTAEGL